VRRGAGAGFTDAYPDPRQRELPKIVGHGAKRRHQRPDRGCNNDDGLAVASIGIHRDGDAEHGVEDCEDRAAEDADFDVAEAELRLYRRHQDAQQNPVGVVRDIDENEQP